MNINTSYNYTAFYSAQRYTAARERNISSMIDKDEDKTLSADELSSFASEYAERTGSELDLTSVMDVYDSDEDGALSEDEQEAMNSAKALESLLDANHPHVKDRFVKPPVVEDIDADSDSMTMQAYEKRASVAANAYQTNSNFYYGIW